MFVLMYMKKSEPDVDYLLVDNKCRGCKKDTHISQMNGIHQNKYNKQNTPNKISLLFSLHLTVGHY